MFIYGKKSKKLKSAPIRDVVCPYCKSSAGLDYLVYQKYFHLYYIPTFPLKKYTVAECDACDTAFEWRLLPEDIQRKITRAEEMHPAATPLSMFSGLFALAGLTALAFYISSNTWQKEAGYVAAPKVGDIYYYDLDSVGHYTSLRVDDVSDDSIYYTKNSKTIYGATKVATIDSPEHYTGKKATFTKQRLKQLYGANTIFNIKREK